MNNIRIAEIIKLEFVGELGRIRVQFQDPTSQDIEEGVLIYETGDNACPAVGDQCMVFQIGCDYGMNYVKAYDIDSAPKILQGEKIIYGAKGNKVYLKQDGSILIEATGDQKITVTTPEGNFSQDINLGGVLKVNDIKVVGNQGTAIADATDLGTAISQLNLLLAAVRTHGLIA